MWSLLPRTWLHSSHQQFPPDGQIASWIRWLGRRWRRWSSNVSQGLQDTSGHSWSQGCSDVPWVPAIWSCPTYLLPSHQQQTVSSHCQTLWGQHRNVSEKYLDIFPVNWFPCRWMLCSVICCLPSYLLATDEQQTQSSHWHSLLGSQSQYGRQVWVRKSPKAYISNLLLLAK